MDETERMTALKKAYAEIILNSAKEAAARVMLSERKACEYQRDLSATKEEALRLLMRVKMMMENKINEVETKSLVQQKKIEELEAQLQEAEDIVSSLRAELSDALAEVERLSRNSQQPSNKPNLIKKSVGGQTDNGVEEKGTLMPPSPESVAASTFESNNLALNHSSSEARHNSANNYLGNCSYVDKPDAPSVFMRMKELYRKGCTQRIQASERNLSDEHLPIPGRLNNLQEGDKLIKEAKHHTEHCVLPSLGPAQKCMVEKQPAAIRTGKRLRVGPLVGAKQRRVGKEQTEVEEATNINVAVHNTLAVNSFHRKRKRGVRVRRNEISLLKSVPVQIKEEFEAPNVSFSETCVADSLSNLSKFYNDEDEDNLNSDMKLSVPCNVSKPAAPSESKYVADEAATKDDMELADSLVLMTQVNAPRSDSVKNLQTTLKSENDSSMNPDDKLGGASDDIAYQLPKERVLKYTFQRKRKKGALSSTDDKEGQQQENPSKKRPVKKQNCAVEDQKPSLVTESSRDSRRLAQVARQLISLSEKKWWT